MVSLSLSLSLSLSCLVAGALAQKFTPDIDCYEGNGSGYRGTVSVTIDGTICQDWKAEEPHAAGAQYGAGPANHCRNPGGDQVGPWCFTTSRLVKWQFCAIAKCDDVRAYIAAGHQCYFGRG